MGVLASSPSCSVIVDSNGNQCEVDADCSSRAGGPFACSADKLCVLKVADIECTTNAQCLEKDSNKICRKSDSTCVPLKTDECLTIDGDPKNDDAFLIGSVLPSTGPDDLYGKPVELAIQLALQQIKSQQLGVPTAETGVYRPILYIGCTDYTNGEDTAVKAATHLSSELGVSAIIGEAFSGSTLAVANSVTIKNGTLIISPSATSDSITDLLDKDLVWRTSPPDKLQAAALKLYSLDVEQRVRDTFVVNGGMPTDPVRIAVLHNKDAYGQGLAAGLVASPPLTINGKPVNDPSNANYYLNEEYDENDATSQVNVAKKLAEVFHPHIIMTLGFNEAVAMMTTIETKWTGKATERPLYVFPDAVSGSDLYTAVETNDALRLRVSGTIPGTAADNPQFQLFKDLYVQQFGIDATTYPPDTFGAAGGYDAVFLIMYAAATLKGAPETGAKLALGMKNLSKSLSMPPKLVDAGAMNLSGGFKELLDKMTIDYNGASGPLNFDPDTGEAQSDIQIWCANKGMTVGIKNTGLYYDAAKGALGGALDPSACQ